MLHCLPPDSQWRPQAFFLFQLAAFVLLLSWIFPQQASLWQWLDIPFFHFINGSLGHWQPWDLLWALLSTRLSDILALCAMLWLMLRRDLVFSPEKMRTAFVSFVTLLFFMLLIRIGFSSFIAMLDLKRGSPNHLLDSGYRLSSCYPQFGRFLSVKDSAASSFPGDHATVLMLWMLFMSFYARGKKLLLCLCIGLLFMAPRLIAGAHWLSDNIVGGGFIVLQATAWFYFTALGRLLYRLFFQLARPCFYLLEKTPLLNKMTIAKAA